MKRQAVALIGAAVLAAASAQAQTAARPAQAKATIDSGIIVGETKDGVNTFRGVPYAKPPVGALRWKPPQKPDKWTYERSAVQFASPCPQVTNPDGITANGGGVAGATNEDCLYLNVYTPANAQNAPVFVWLYGGASRLGGSHLGGYNGTPNAKQGVITVTINYRLGPLGGFSHPALTKEAKKDEGLGSYALMDAVAALDWVKRNAKAFGGDPDNVTVGGQSAGGGMVTQLLSIPSAKGLYHKAIIQSGAALRPGTPLAEAEKAGAEAITKGFGLPATATAAQLRAIDASSLANNPATVNSLGTPIENRFKPTSTLAALEAGTEIDVPVMVGSNSGEGGFDGARRLAKLAGDSGAGTWLYHFAYVPAWRTEWRNGAVHSAELMFSFGTTETSSWAKGPNGSVTDADRAVARKVHSCWVAFFKMDPKANSLTCADGFTWPAYTDAADDAVQFTATPKLVKSKTIPNGPPQAAAAAPAN